MVSYAMPRNIYDGVLNRQKCEPRRPLRVIYTVGTGVPTPDCMCMAAMNQQLTEMVLPMEVQAKYTM